ncbi:MAG TPA: hypothetical protein VMM58_10920 [Bacteroidota bacterium]|nr:hypothetical protein [Bacteroidota bacterium]
MNAQENIRHLTDEELALYGDAIVLEMQDRLPPTILIHVMECEHCKKELMGLFDVIEGQEPYVDGDRHPVLGRRSS